MPENSSNQQSPEQNPETEKLKSEILDIVIEDKARRDQAFPFFRNTTLLEYTDTARQQFLGWREKPDYKEDYQYNVFDPIPRDKIMAIVSKTSGYYEAQFFNTNKRLNKFSEVISNIISALYKDICYRLKDKDQNRETMIAALTTPKAIRFIGWQFKKRKINEIVERDEKTGRITKTDPKEIVYSNEPYSELIPVEDLIPGSLRERDIQQQPRLSWISRMQEDTFKRNFSEALYPKRGDVKPLGALLTADGLEYTPLSNDLKENEIEVIRFFNKWDDEYHVIANGIQLTEKGNPMPFAHKDYPFTWAGFEMLDPKFIYDMPMTIKLLDMTDANNEVINLTLDMLWRALSEVVLVKDGDEFNSDVLYAGGMVGVDDPQNFQKFSFGNPTAFSASEQLLKRIKESLEHSSVDAAMAGQAGSGRQITAREVLVAREAAIEIASLFLETMESMKRDEAVLMVKNMLDRYQKPIDWKKRIGEKLFDEAQPVFKSISVRNTKLSEGKKGILNVNIVSTPRPKEELYKEDDDINEMSQTIEISPDFIRDIEFEVEIIPGSSVKRSKQVEIAESRQFLADAAAMPQYLNPKAAAEDYVKKLGKNPQDFLPEENPAGSFAEMGAKEVPGLKNLATELPL